MKDRVFLDTNIFIYLYSESETHKRDIVYQIFDSNYCITSLQAFNEASNVWFKKYNWDGLKIHRHLDNIELLCDEVLMIGRNTINEALSLKGDCGYSYYDCLMLSSALESNCNIILTEDMSNGQVICKRLKISNPFAKCSK